MLCVRREFFGGGGGGGGGGANGEGARDVYRTIPILGVEEAGQHFSFRSVEQKAGEYEIYGPGSLPPPLPPSTSRHFFGFCPPIAGIYFFDYDIHVLLRDKPDQTTFTGYAYIHIYIYISFSSLRRHTRNVLHYK